VPDPSRYRTCPKAADYLAERHGISVADDYVRRLIRSGELPLHGRARSEPGLRDPRPGVRRAVGELEDGRVDQLLEERSLDVGLDDYEDFYWSDPDR
jgi:hypothetical protein